MINIDKDSHLELYQDWNKCLNFLNNLNYGDYKYPKEVSNFHIYSEIKTEKELLSVKSFLATQNLDETNLVLWSDYDIKENKFLFLMRLPDNKCGEYNKFLDLYALNT